MDFLPGLFPNSFISSDGLILVRRKNVGWIVIDTVTDKEISWHLRKEDAMKAGTNYAWTITEEYTWITRFSKSLTIDPTAV